MQNKMRPIIFLSAFVCVTLAGRMTRRVLTCTERASCDICVSRPTCVYIYEAHTCIHRNDRKNYTIKSTVSSVSGCASLRPDPPILEPEAPKAPASDETYPASPPSIHKPTGEGHVDVNFDPPPVYSVVDSILSNRKIRGNFSMTNWVLQNRTEKFCDTALYMAESWNEKMLRSMCRTAKLMRRHRLKLSPEFSAWASRNPMSDQKEMCQNLENNRLNKPSH